MKATLREGRAMGSPLRLTLPGSDEAAADAAWDVVRGTFDRAERALTRFRPEGPLSRLNRRTGQPTRVPPPLTRALAASWRAFRVSRGRYDPRIIGALEAAGERAGVPLPPSPARLLPTDRWLRLDARRGLATIAAPVDLGGIGKGLALRWAAAALRRAGHAAFLVGAGGDVVARGPGPGGRPWVVALASPGGGPPLARLELCDAALATSSIEVRSWRAPNGGLLHHLIDPASLAPVEPAWTSVTVRHPDPAWAEVLSKAGFVARHRIGEAVGPWPAWTVDLGGRLGAVSGSGADAAVRPVASAARRLLG